MPEVCRRKATAFGGQQPRRTQTWEGVVEEDDQLQMDVASRQPSKISSNEDGATCSPPVASTADDNEETDSPVTNPPQDDRDIWGDTDSESGDYTLNCPFSPLSRHTRAAWPFDGASRNGWERASLADEAPEHRRGAVFSTMGSVQGSPTKALSADAEPFVGSASRSPDEQPTSAPPLLASNWPPAEGSIGTPSRSGGRRERHRKGKAGKGQSDKLTKVTTVMIRNLPSDLKQQDFVSELDSSGFDGLYDFCYLPRDFSSGLCKGYAFVNFVESTDAAHFRSVWHQTDRFGVGQPWVDVSPAHIQGYEANAAMANSAHVCKVRNPIFRRLVMTKERGEPCSPANSLASTEPPSTPCGYPSAGALPPLAGAAAGPLATLPPQQVPTSRIPVPGPVPQPMFSSYAVQPPFAGATVSPQHMLPPPMGYALATPSDPVSPTIFTVMGSQQPGMSMGQMQMPVTSTPHYCRFAAR